MKFHIRQNGNDSGPFTQEQLLEMVYSGQVARSVLACPEGGTEWLPLQNHFSEAKATARSAPTPAAIDLKQLHDAREGTAFFWLALAAAPLWLAVLGYAGVSAYFTHGLALAFFAAIAGFIWLIRAMGEMFFMAYLKTNTVRVSATQLPEVHRIVASSCAALQMGQPEVYVMQANVWNSFAAKIFKRRIVILLSGAVDSILLKGDNQQLAWLVGHELGHHWAGHFNFGHKLARWGSWCIWVALWHSRRAELTCDRVGLYCAGSIWASRYALMNATVGAQLAGKINMDEAVRQWWEHRGEFFVKYRTMYSTHPHLLARLDHLNLAAAEFGISR